MASARWMESALGVGKLRIIPISKWLITMVGKSPRVVGPLPNGRFMAYIWG